LISRGGSNLGDGNGGDLSGGEYTEAGLGGRSKYDLIEETRRFEIEETS